MRGAIPCVIAEENNRNALTCALFGVNKGVIDEEDSTNVATHLCFGTAESICGVVISKVQFIKDACEVCGDPVTGQLLNAVLTCSDDVQAKGLL